MLAVLTQTEIVVVVIVGFFYLVALLSFVLALLRGSPRPIWGRLRFGIFVERKSLDESEEDEDGG